MSTNQIQKSVILNVPRGEVWHTLSDVKSFGQWFGVKMKGSFSPGEHMKGKITLKGYENLSIEFTIQRMESGRFLSWRWHPYAINRHVDYSAEPKTLVEFELEDIPGGSRLLVTESGFDAIPSSRRAEAYEANEKGWAMQLESIRQFLKRAA